MNKPFGKGDIYTAINEETVFEFGDILNILESNGINVSIISEIGYSNIIDKKTSYLHFNGYVWEVTLQTPSMKRRATIDTFINALKEWKLNPINDAVNEFIRIGIESVNEEYEVNNGSYYIRVCNEEGKETSNDDLFITFEYEWKENMTVLNFKRFQSQLTKTIRGILSHFNVYMVDVSHNISNSCYSNIKIYEQKEII